MCASGAERPIERKVIVTSADSNVSVSAQPIKIYLQNDTMIQQLRDDVIELRGDVTELRDNVSQIRDHVTELRDNLTKLRDDVKELCFEVRRFRRS